MLFKTRNIDKKVNNRDDDQLSKQAINALCSSYEHPWHKVKKKLDFIEKKQNFVKHLIDK